MTRDAKSTTPHSFDYSTPEAQDALEGLSALLLEIRDEYAVVVPQEIARGFDYSTPEGLDALKGVSSVLLQLRDECSRAPELAAMERKVAFYERTLGLAVIPVLLRRAAYALYYRARAGTRGIS